jgi:hypothetical protein
VWHLQNFLQYIIVEFFPSIIVPYCPSPHSWKCFNRSYFSFPYMCIQYIHHVQPPIPFPHILPTPTGNHHPRKNLSAFLFSVFLFFYFLFIYFLIFFPHASLVCSRFYHVLKVQSPCCVCPWSNVHIWGRIYDSWSFGSG